MGILTQKQINRKKRKYLKSQRWVKNMIRDAKKCVYCKCDFDEEKYRKTIDHVIPLSQGGSNFKPNLVVACSYCNHKKGKEEDMKLSLIKETSG